MNTLASKNEADPWRKNDKQKLTFRPQKWNLKAHMWYHLSPFPAPMGSSSNRCAPRLPQKRNKNYLQNCLLQRPIRHPPFPPAKIKVQMLQRIIILFFSIIVWRGPGECAQIEKLWRIRFQSNHFGWNNSAVNF